VRGSAYLPLVNAFFVHEFQMMHAAEDATRFLHQACQGLPQRLRRGNSDGDGSNSDAARPRQTATDDFYARMIEHAVAYFGSRILYPSRPVPEDSSPLSRVACEKAAQAAARGGSKFEASAKELGYRMGAQIYDAYLAGKVAPSSLRRLFLIHLDQPGNARRVCAAVIAKLRSFSKSRARSAQA
jgi:hypothetical protein